MKDLRLTEDGDLYITENGDVQFTDSVLQAIKIRLKWFLAEWRINTNYGMPYYDKVFVKNPSTALIEDRIRTEILSVDGVQTIESISVVIDKTTRVATIQFKVVAQEQVINEEVKVNV